MKLIIQTILALGVLAFLCPGCNLNEGEDTPQPVTIDLEGTWQIRTNSWHKHSAVENFGDDVYPGTFAFDEYRESSGTGSFSYQIDGEQLDETFTYQILNDTLRILPNQLPENRTSTFIASDFSEEHIYLEGVTETVESSGLMEVLTEEMILEK